MGIYEKYYLAETKKSLIGGVWAIGRSLLISLGIGALNAFRGGLSVTDAIVNVTTGTLFGLILVIGGAFVVNVIQAPAKLNQERLKEIAERDEKIKDVQEQKQSLEERAKPKLEIQLVEGEATHRQTLSVSYDGVTIRQQTIFRVSIHNASTVETIDGISVELSDIEPNRLPYIPAELHSMNDSHKTLNPDGRLFVDVLGIEEWSDDSGAHRRLFWYFDHTPIRDLKEMEMRDYAIRIAASGKGSPLVSRDFKFVIDNDGICHLTT